MLVWLPPLLLLVVFLIGVWIDSRRFGLGLILTAALSWAALLGFSWLFEQVTDASGEMTAAWFLLGAVGLMGLLIAVLGAFLIVNTVTMRRKEGLGMAAKLSGAIGVAIMAYVVGAVLVVAQNWASLVGWVLFLGLPAGYVAYLFVSYVLYSQLYQWGTRTFGGPVKAVVVLGSGLRGGERVTPLLAGRLERGRAVFERSAAAGREPILVVSGGKGSDERISEAQAMQNWLVERDFPADAVVREDRSTDTEENLVYSAEVMRQWGADGEVAVATSNYHAFRAAVIMRKAGIPGYTVGCRTARYYWPSATIREFVAILLEHSRLNMVLIGLLCLPLLALVVNSVAGLF